MQILYRIFCIYTDIEKRYKHKFCWASGLTYKKVNNKPIGLPKAQGHKDPFDKSRLRLKDNRYQTRYLH